MTAKPLPIGSGRQQVFFPRVSRPRRALMIKKSLSLLVVAGLLLTLWWYPGRLGEALPGATVLLPPIQAQDAGGLRQVNVPAAVNGEALPGGSPAWAEFESAQDLYGYAQGLRVAARNGDAEALWLLSKVYDYCAVYADHAAGYEDDTRRFAALGMPEAKVMARARGRVSQRCARFTPSDGLSPLMVASLRAQAARAGSLPAEAALLAKGEPVADTTAYRRDLMERVRGSRDPEAFLAISSAMGPAASGYESALGPVSGNELAELAWKLAACRLGANCASQGSLMTSYCANGGICSRDASQDFSAFVQDAGVPRLGADKLNEMVNGLVAEKEGDL